MSNESLCVEAKTVEALGIYIPGVAANSLEAQLLNIDPSRGLITTIIIFKPGTVIPAHFHTGGSEAHYVLEGEMTNAGRVCGPGTFLTHAANVVHGPHGSVGGCRVLTMRSTDFDLDDHHVVENPSNEKIEKVSVDTSATGAL